MANRRRVIWVLNLDAELELARPGSYNPARAMKRRIHALRPRISQLVQSADVVLEADEPYPPLEAQDVCQAWCPTPRALGTFRERGLPEPPGPALEVLREVNSRAFSAKLGQWLPGAALLHDMDALRERVAQPSPTGWWLVKRAFGFAGRGRRRIPPTGPTPDDLTFCKRSLQEGHGVQVEPWVERLQDHSIHAWLFPDGTFEEGPVLLQRYDSWGSWQGSEVAPPETLGVEEKRCLRDAMHRAVHALHGRGYHGPLGIDGYRYLGADGGQAYNPLSDLNARFTMGYMGPQPFRDKPPA